MTALSPNQAFGTVVHDLSRLYRRRFEQLARSRRLGLTRAQASLIMQLARHEGINQVNLAQIMELEPITLVRLLDRLEAAGLVERRPDPKDRRARRLFLKPSAYAQIARITSVVHEVQAESLDDVASPERQSLFRIMLAIKANLLERAGDQRVGGDIELGYDQVSHG